MFQPGDHDVNDALCRVASFESDMCKTVCNVRGTLFSEVRSYHITLIVVMFRPRLPDILLPPNSPTN